jgi:hypothetical protein
MTTIKRIAEDRFDDMLWTLPPEQWIQEQGKESFRFQERLDDITAWYFCRIGRDYYEIKGAIDLTHNEVVSICEELCKETIMICISQ